LRAGTPAPAPVAGALAANKAAGAPAAGALAAAAARRAASDAAAHCAPAGAKAAQLGLWWLQKPAACKNESVSAGPRK